MAMGMDIKRPSASVVPKSALKAVIATMGPGCGGTSACTIDRPANTGRPEADAKTFQNLIGRYARPKAQHQRADYQRGKGMQPKPRDYDNHRQDYGDGNTKKNEIVL
jgi:hypothetical protein